MKKIILLIYLLLGTFVFLSAQSSGSGPFTLNAPSGATNIQWYLDATAIPSANGTTYSASTGGAYWVQYDDAVNSCSDLHGNINVIIAENDTTITILRAPTGHSNYVWNKDGACYW